MTSAPDPEDVAPDGRDALAAAASDLDGWDMLLGFTLANLEAVMADQARTFLSGDDPDAIPVVVRDGAGGLTCALGLPQLSIALADGARLTLPLADVVLDGRALAPGATDLQLTFRLDLQLETPGWDELLAHPVVHDEVKLSLQRLLDAGEVTRDAHSLALLRPRFTALDLGAALVADATRLAAVPAADRPRLLALIERWLRDLGPARNPFFLGCMILTRRVTPRPWMQPEPTVASFAYLSSFGARRRADSQIAFLLNCDHRPVPPGHQPGAIGIIRFPPPDPDAHQGMLALLPGLLLDRHLVPKARALLGLEGEPPGAVAATRVYQRLERIDPAGVPYNECLRITERVSVGFAAANGTDAVRGRFGAIVTTIRYDRVAVGRKFDARGGDLDKTRFTDADFDTRFPMSGALTATVTCRFTVVDRRLQVDHDLTTTRALAPETDQMFARWRSAGPNFAYEALTRIFTEMLQRHDTGLEQLGAIRIDVLGARCVLPGRNQVSYRDPQVTRCTAFDSPFALYFSVTRNV